VGGGAEAEVKIMSKIMIKIGISNFRFQSGETGDWALGEML
jgi:hypothetical protein